MSLKLQPTNLHPLLEALVHRLSEQLLEDGPVLRFYLPPVAAGLTIALPVFTVLAWKNKHWFLWQRSHYTLTTLLGFQF